MSPVASQYTATHVYAAALEISDREGMPALTMKRLASELRIGTMTLYGYVRSKQELIDGVVELAVGELEIPEQGPWEERLAQLFRNLRRLMLDHPTIVHAVPRPLTGPGSLRATDAALGIVRESGVDGMAAIQAMTALISYTFGATVFHLNPEGDERRQYQRDVRGADPDELPNIAALNDEFLASESEAEFEAGLHMLIDGLVRRSGDGTQAAPTVRPARDRVRGG
jgi:AcrR family transcriptional regulator